MQMTRKILAYIALMILVVFSCEERKKQIPIKSEDVLSDWEYTIEDRIDIPSEDQFRWRYNADSTARVFDSLTWENLMYLESVDTVASEYNANASEFTSPSKAKKTKYYVFHCTASKEGIDLDLQWFLDFFKNERKWSRPGYSELLTLDGKWHQMHPNNYDGFTSYEEMTYGVRGINSISMHFAYVGGVDKNLKAKDTATDAQVAAIREKIIHIKCFDPYAKVIFGHRDHPGVTKACPSFDLKKKFSDLIDV